MGVMFRIQIRLQEAAFQLSTNKQNTAFTAILLYLGPNCMLEVQSTWNAIIAPIMNTYLWSLVHCCDGYYQQA